MGIKSIALKAAGVTAGAVLGTCVGNSAAISFEGLTDLVAFHTGNAPLKFGMKNPAAKWFKGYFIENPYTHKVIHVSKKKWLKLMAEQPQLINYVKLVGGGLVLAGAAVVIGKTTYDCIVGKPISFSKKDLEDFIMSDEFDDLDEDEFMDELEPADDEEEPEDSEDSQQEDKTEEK